MSRVRLSAWLLLASGLLPAGGATAQVEADLVARGSQNESAERVIELTLADAVELGLQHNLQIRIASLNPDLSAEQIRSARAQFDPVFVFDLPQQFRRTSQPQSSVLGGADVLTQEQIVGGFSLTSDTTWGLNWSLAARTSRSVTNNQFSTFNPRWDTSLSLQLRQPLLRNRGEANQRTLLVARNDFTVSQEQFRLQLQNAIFQVIQAYWGLVNSYRALEISQDSLRLAEEQHRNNQARVRIGVLAAVDVIQTEQQVADAELTLLQSQLQLRNQQDLMRSLLNLDAVVEQGWEVQIVPTDAPALTALNIDIEVAVAEALEKSPRIRQSRTNLDSRQIDVRASRNQMMPQLDFIGGATLNGLGGDQIFRSGDIFGNGGISEVQTGNLEDAFRQMFSGDFRDWSLGLQVSFPVRNDLAEAQHAQATIRQRQAQDLVRDDEIQIRLGVRNAARNVDGGVQQVAAAQNAVLLAERQYQAELRRFETGTSSTFQVLSLQRQLTGARLRELNALIGLNVALANFELNKGTLLEIFGVEIEDAGTGGSRVRRGVDSATATPTRAAQQQPR